MKTPKNRGNLYVVVRELDGRPAALLGSFADAVEADDYKGAMAAEWFDKTRGAPASFAVLLVTFYG